MIYSRQKYVESLFGIQKESVKLSRSVSEILSKEFKVVKFGYSETK